MKKKDLTSQKEFLENLFEEELFSTEEDLVLVRGGNIPPPINCGNGCGLGCGSGCGSGCSGC